MIVRLHLVSFCNSMSYNMSFVKKHKRLVVGCFEIVTLLISPNCNSTCNSSIFLVLLAFQKKNQLKKKRKRQQKRNRARSNTLEFRIKRNILHICVKYFLVNEKNPRNLKYRKAHMENIWKMEKVWCHKTSIDVHFIVDKLQL